MTTLRRTSQFGPLAAAIVTAVEADSLLSGLLATPGIWNTTAPETSPFPYLVLGFSLESAADVFGAPGVVTGQTIDIWTRKSTVTGSGAGMTLGADQLWAIYSALYGLLHGTTLSVAGFLIVSGTLTMQATMVDPDGESLHGIARYEVTSRQTA